MDYLNDEIFEGLTQEEIEQLNSELCVSFLKVIIILIVSW